MTVARALAAALAAATAGPAGAQGPLLGEVALDAPSPLAPPPWTVVLAVRGARDGMLTELRARYGDVRQEGDGVRLLQPAGYAALPDPPAPGDLASTFTVDHEEPAVSALRPAVAAAAGERPRVADLARFVAAHVADKNLSRSFDPASVVAARREGDCSEHAVLLAALCRLYRIPARVVTGFVVIARGELPPAAFGHAWVEAFEDGRWQVADATDPWAASPVHVPIWTLRSEGPGLGIEDATRISFLQVSGVSLRPAAR